MYQEAELDDRKKLAEEKRKEANVLFDREMYQEAVKKYTIAIKYDENQASSFGKRSEAFLAMDNHQNALEVLGPRIQTRPTQGGTGGNELGSAA